MRHFTLLIFAILFMCLPHSVSAQAVTARNSIWNPTQRTIRYEYRLMNPTSDAVEKIDVYVPLPFESPRQEIHYLRMPEVGRSRIFTDQHGQRLVHYEIERLEPSECVELGYVAGVTMQNMCWNYESGEASPVLTTEQRTLYLRPETNYSMDSDFMIETAASLIEGATSDYEKLVRIHDHVIESVRYVRDDQWDPAEVVLSRGTGSCSEYNYVLSGLCRLAGLPTRCAGGSTNVFRDLPTTDTVFHRWTEVYLSDYGWFPVDCSRDANPIRGRRSHFGRVYVDALVWCRQAGGEDDTLGWDYRAKAHPWDQAPGIRENHRVRWFPYHEEEDVDAAFQWFLEDGETTPVPDLLECAVLRWSHAGEEERLKLIDALAQAGRIECLRRSAFLSEEGGLRERRLNALCVSPELADTFLEKIEELWGFRNWFKSIESKLSGTEDGRFMQARSVSRSTPTTTVSSSEIWDELCSDAIGRLEGLVELSDDDVLVIMPVTDQTSAGLGGLSDAIHAMLKECVLEELELRLVNEERLERWMTEQGPGRQEYWILANGDVELAPLELRPDVIVVPVCIVTEESGSVLYRLDLKVLKLEGCKYVTVTSRMRQTEDSVR
jgi:transglutaminase-like putative cysteine protease